MSAPRPWLAVVRFATEVATVAAVPWGITGLIAGPSGWLLALVATGALVAGWGRFVAPKAPHRLADPCRLAVEVTLFVAVGAVLAGRSVALAVALTAVSSAAAVAVRSSGVHWDHPGVSRPA